MRRNFRNEGNSIFRAIDSNSLRLGGDVQDEVVAQVERHFFYETSLRVDVVKFYSLNVSIGDFRWPSGT